jgi:hypothetical protein
MNCSAFGIVSLEYDESIKIEWHGAMPLLIKKNMAPCIADVPFFISSNDL